MSEAPDLHLKMYGKDQTRQNSLREIRNCCGAWGKDNLLFKERRFSSFFPNPPLPSLEKKDKTTEGGRKKEHTTFSNDFFFFFLNLFYFI